jgi:hypothetical protein
MKTASRYIFMIFIVVAIVDLWLSQSGNENFRHITKPLLIPLLMLGYLLSINQPLNSYAKLIFGGLFFSWLGDIFLMFEDPGGIWFICGLLAFLTTHLFYIRYFSKTISSSESYFRKRPILFLAVLAYLIELLYILWPHLQGMKVPVLLYGIIISFMLIMALWQYGKLSSYTAWIFIGGAMFFVASDSLLAIDKFKQHFPFAELLIMSTYVLAQYLIVQGSIRHLKEPVRSYHH